MVTGVGATALAGLGTGPCRLRDGGGALMTESRSSEKLIAA